MKKINVVKDNLRFNEIIKTGKYVKDNNLIIYRCISNDSKYRFGISVPKKLCHAYLRNYYKRVLRSICDNNKNLYSNKDYVIIVRKGSLNSDYSKIENSFKFLMNKLEKENTK